MGLDMYFNARNKDGKQDETIYYFRKHSDLNGWLQDKWLEEDYTRDPEDFNCDMLQITEDIVNELEEYINNGKFERYSGFFWGQSTLYDWEETKENLIPILREYLREGYEIYYSANW